MKKKVLIGVLLLIELCSIYLMYRSSNNKEVLDNKEIKEEKKEKFAIMVQDDTGKYNKSSDTTFPSGGYFLNTTKTECLDIEGNKIDNSISEINGSVTLTNKYTSYCTLYFDKCSQGKGTVLEGKEVTECPVGGLYRYQGTDNVNNYICFGTNNKSKCTQGGDNYGDGIDKYMYRIIGVTPDGELALIKENEVKEKSVTRFQWNNKSAPTEAECGSDGSKCTWPLSTLYNRLNGLCNSDNPNCLGTTSGTSGDTNIFIGNSYYEYLNSSSAWYNKISNHTWKYGESMMEANDLKFYNGNTVYAIENTFTDKVTAKIGLQYIYDYLYAYPGEIQDVYIGRNAWINVGQLVEDSSFTWSINRYSLLKEAGGGLGERFNALAPCWDGGIGNVMLELGMETLPVFYLKNDITFKSGTTGSESNPYIIDGMPEDKTTIEQLREKDTKNQITTSLVGGMYRYQGTDDVNNWICFGTNNKSTCTSTTGIDKYMYRIIGVTFEGELALIKETGVKEGSTTEFQWNDKYTKTDCDSNGSKCTWNLSKLYNRLNGLCNSSNTNCTGTGSGSTGQSNIFIGNSYYEYLSNNTWLSKISNHTWKYGDTTSNGNFVGDTMYNIENAFTENVPSAKIGLQYLHDYHYACPGGQPGSNCNPITAWINKKNNGESYNFEWLLTRYGYNNSNSMYAWYSVNGALNTSINTPVGIVRPVFYLTSYITINGSGAKGDPFIITN